MRSPFFVILYGTEYRSVCTVWESVFGGRLKNNLHKHLIHLSESFRYLFIHGRWAFCGYQKMKVNSTWSSSLFGVGLGIVKILDHYICLPLWAMYLSWKKYKIILFETIQPLASSDAFYHYIWTLFLLYFLSVNSH